MSLSLCKSKKAITLAARKLFIFLTVELLNSFALGRAEQSLGSRMANSMPFLAWQPYRLKASQAFAQVT